MLLPLSILALFACQDTYESHVPFESCSSVRLDSNGVITLTDYDSSGWPIRIEVQFDGVDPVITDIEYSRVAGRVVESLSVTDTLAVSTTYDAHEHFEASITNIEGDEGISCSNLHDAKDRLIESDCTTGIKTVYDLCQNPDRVEFEGGEENYGYTYNRCQILSGQIVGLDDIGLYSENFQYVLGRPISTVHERDGFLTSSFTTWDCPTPAE